MYISKLKSIELYSIRIFFWWYIDLKLALAINLIFFGTLKMEEIGDQNSRKWAAKWCHWLQKDRPKLAIGGVVSHHFPESWAFWWFLDGYTPQNKHRTWKWPLKEEDIFLEAIIFRFHVKFLGCICQLAMLCMVAYWWRELFVAVDMYMLSLYPTKFAFLDPRCRISSIKKYVLTSWDIIRNWFTQPKHAKQMSQSS